MADDIQSNINYKLSGNSKNPALVFLHFFGGSLHTWDTLIETLQKDFYCLAMDLPGFGASPVQDSYLTVKDSAQQVTELIESFAIEDYTLMGHSMGGKIALYIAAQHLPQLKQLILVAPSPPTPEPGTDESRKELLNTFSDPEELKKLINKLTYHPLPEAIFKEVLNDHMQVSKTGWDGWIKQGSQEDISSLMNDIEIPVNVICSPDDPNFPPSVLKPILTKYLPSAKVIEIKKTGHLIPVEATEELSAVILKVLK